MKNKLTTILATSTLLAGISLAVSSCMPIKIEKRINISYKEVKPQTVPETVPETVSGNLEAKIKKGGYFVIIASHRDLAKAYGAVERAKKRGINAVVYDRYTNPKTGKINPYYGVMAGEWLFKPEAEAILKMVREKGYSDAYLWTFPK